MRRLLILAFVITGCSVKKGGELTTAPTVSPSPSPSPTPTTDYITTTELNSGAQTLVATASNYKVAHTVKSAGDTIKTESSGGYKVYLNVQGTYFSEGP